MRAPCWGYHCGRGDDSPGAARTRSEPELPLRARGRRADRLVGHLLGRATPAGAGTTTSGPAPTRTCASYPRGRGDDTRAGAEIKKDQELPPRARGRRVGAGGEGGDAGATPAGAGTTSPQPSERRRTRSYPRGRGDDRVWGFPGDLQQELPPRARGRQHAVVPAGGVVGATPAGAGTTPRRSRSRRRPRSYPRGRGDDALRLIEAEEAKELPPRARGRPERVGLFARDLGATPAGAGTTRAGGNPRSARGSYPRGRGDDRQPLLNLLKLDELPPRARGRHAHHVIRALRRRATPAGAGTTTRPPSPAATPWSYPRGRGDDENLHVRARGQGELPPRARGRHFVTCGDVR